MLSDSREPKHPRINPASYYNQQNYFANANLPEENLVFSDSNSTPSSPNQTGNEQEQNINDECKVCVVLSKPGDLACILNQGLYHKYTSSQDFFYTKDITSLIEKKRSEFAINYYDDKIFDEDKEHLKQFFKRKDSKALMDEIKNFYSQFYNFPRNFHKDFFKLVNTNIVRHRRLEYIKVFHNSTLPQDQSTDQNAGDLQNNFDLMKMLGETFLHENYKDISEITKRAQKPGQRRETEQYISEVENNFNLLKHLAPDKKHIENSEAKVSNALYNRQFMLYSRNDSEAAEEMIKDVLEGFREEPKKTLTRKKSGEIKVMRTKKPESETEITTTATTAGETKKPSFVHRQESPGKNFQISQSFVPKEILKELNGATNMKKEADYLTDRILGNNTKSDTTRATLVDHSDSNKMGRQDSTPNFHNVNRPKPLNIPKKSIKTSVPLMKFTIENLKESLVDKESILNKVNQLRTTQHKPINFRTEELKNRTPNSVPNKPLILSGDPMSAGNVKPKHLRVSYLYSPNTLQTPSAEMLLVKKRDGKSSKILRPRPEIKPASEARGSKSGLHHRDSSGPGFFDATSTNRNNKNSRIFEVESPGMLSSTTLRTTKSSTKLISKQMGRSTPSSIIDNKFEPEIINSKNLISSVCFEPPRNEKKKLSMAMERKPSQEPLESTERDGYITKQSRSMSSGIQKLRVEVSPEKKRTKSHLKGNKSISGVHHNMLDLSQGFTPLIDPRMLIRHKGSDFNAPKGQQRTPESSSQNINIRKRKSQSNANTVYYPASISISGKETKKASLALEEEDFMGSAGRASPLREDHQANFWSPKITKRILHKDKILVKPNTVKGTKHIRYQSRG